MYLDECMNAAIRTIEDSSLPKMGRQLFGYSSGLVQRWPLQRPWQWCAGTMVLCI